MRDTFTNHLDKSRSADERVNARGGFRPLGVLLCLVAFGAVSRDDAADGPRTTVRAQRRRRASKHVAGILAAIVVAMAAAVAVVGPAGSASAEQEPVLVGQHGTHSIWVSYDEPYDVENLNTFWDLVPLDGMCGFAGTKLVLSDMTETFFLQDNPQTGSFTGIGKILDETFELTQYDAEGNEVALFHGTGDEYAQFRGTGDQGYKADLSANLRVMFRGASDDGTRLAFSIKMRLRFDHRTGELTRFDAAVDGCHVN